MSRNKYPEETRKKILSVSSRLFLEKGYENTTIQDILDELGGLTKGAIYHHFASKEDIILTVLEQQYHQYDERWFRELLTDKEMTGRQKLSQMFRTALSSPRQADLLRSAPKLLENPKMLTLELKALKEEVAPIWILPIIREGMADGTIQTEYPDELAEIIVLLVNLWVVPMTFPGEKEELLRRIHFFKLLMKNMGVDFVDEDMIKRFEYLIDLHEKHQ